MNQALLISLFMMLLSNTICSQNRARIFEGSHIYRNEQVGASSVRSIVSRTTLQNVKQSSGAKLRNKEPSEKGILRRTTSLRSSESQATIFGTLGAFTTGDPKIDLYIRASSEKYSIDPLLIYAQMQQESSFKRRARSHKGASGLMQLMPATARRFGVTDIYDPKQNIEAGIRYMRWLLNKFDGDVHLALAGYNAGEGAVLKYGRRVPPYRETREYVRRITAKYRKISTYVKLDGMDEKAVRNITITKPNSPKINSRASGVPPDGRIRVFIK